VKGDAGQKSNYYFNCISLCSAKSEKEAIYNQKMISYNYMRFLGIFIKLWRIIK